MADDDFNLLEKTELRVRPIRLQGANLTAVAARLAEVLGLRAEEVLVTDVRDDTLTLDVLRPTVRPESLLGKRGAILAALAAVAGVTVLPETDLHSEGILGFVALDAALGRDVLARSREIAAEIKARVDRRAMIFSTGAEVQAGLIADTNFPTLAAALEQEGYQVRRGPILPDSRGAISRALYEGAAAGFGVLITTGGIGAEDKDHTVEAVLDLDVQAATPYIVRYEVGTGRHVKDGVRLAVGRLGRSLLIALPGPNDEVRLCLPVLLRGLREACSEAALADALAAPLRRKWRGHHPHPQGPEQGPGAGSSSSQP